MAQPPQQQLPFRSSLAIAATLLLLLLLRPTQSKHPRHVIRLRSPDILRPSSLAYDPFSQHFLVSSLSSPSIHSVSDAGVSQPLLSFPSPASSTLALSLDSHRRRLLSVLTSPSPPPSLASLSLPSHRTLFLSPLPPPSSPAATAVDFHGNTFVTDSLDGIIYRIPESGESPSVFSNSSVFSSTGLDGLAFLSLGYLLVVQSATGRMFKVDDSDGTARRVLLNRDLPGAKGIAIRGDGTAVVASADRVWYVKTTDSWGEGAVYDEVGLDEGKVARDVAVGRDNRVYVLYEGGGGEGEDGIGIEEVRSRREEEEEEGGGMWVYMLIGFGMVYFTIWRFQMRKLVGSLNKKTN
ncbi:hypothetical protein MLD38_031656 [Melastoma candidum]|uniref:Uncharacterized protein n=1 Tax=Melastoma candidum TaxID=119954 RepID=A0ACB9MV19_9MYRT|nr:hypothetical protein MLD38_031656 [Melastoma candidum]